MMEKVLTGTREYLKSMKILDLSAMKACLVALGVTAGVNIKSEYKKPVTIVAGTIFAITYVFVMMRFVAALVKK